MKKHDRYVLTGFLSGVMVFILLAYFLMPTILTTTGFLTWIGLNDSDHDNVPDLWDQCPHTAQLKRLPDDFVYWAAVNPNRFSAEAVAWKTDMLGCEFDTDGDGIVNSQDYCPEDSPNMLSHGVASNGCPVHSDKDGTPDYRDKCPGTLFGTPTDSNGCP